MRNEFFTQIFFIRKLTDPAKNWPIPIPNNLNTGRTIVRIIASFL